MAFVLGMQSVTIASIENNLGRRGYGSYNIYERQTTIVYSLDPKCDNRPVQIWFVAVMGLSLLTTAGLFICYLLKFNEMVQKIINWQLIEIISSSILTLLCFISAVVLVDEMPQCSIYAVASTFAFVLFIGHAITAYCQLKKLVSSKK